MVNPYEATGAFVNGNVAKGDGMTSALDGKDGGNNVGRVAGRLVCGMDIEGDEMVGCSVSSVVGVDVVDTGPAGTLMVAFS